MEKNMLGELKDMLAKNKTQNEILSFISKNGANITEAMVCVRNLYGISLGEAKRIVSKSTYWGEIHRANQDLHDALEDFAKKEIDDKKI